MHMRTYSIYPTYPTYCTYSASRFPIIPIGYSTALRFALPYYTYWALYSTALRACLLYLCRAQWQIHMYIYTYVPLHLRRAPQMKRLEAS